MRAHQAVLKKEGRHPSPGREAEANRPCRRAQESDRGGETSGEGAASAKSIAAVAHRHGRPERPFPGSILALALLLSGCGSDVDGGPLVFAAASLQDALHAGAEAFSRRPAGGSVVFNFAGSNVLARQIEAGAPADAFISADEAWMDFLEERGLLRAETRRSVASNHLVVVANREAPFEMATMTELASLRFRHFAVGDPEAVPAGRYARRYLEGIPYGGGDLWEQVASRVVPAPDVRAALALVEADPDIVGIVYASDALVAPGVRVLYEVAPGEGPPIHYVAAVPKRAARPDEGEAFLRFLASPEAQDILRRYGLDSGER